MRIAPPVERHIPKGGAFPLVGLLAVFATLFSLMLLSVLIYTGALLRSSPVELDANHHLIIKRGYTILARSIEAEGEGMDYHFTRFGSYKAPDWHARKDAK